MHSRCVLPSVLQMGLGFRDDCANSTGHTIQVQSIDLSHGGKQVHFDLLVGADGAGSTVREQLSAVLSEGFIERWTHDIVYSTGPLRDVEPGDFPGHTFMEMHTAQVQCSPVVTVSSFVSPKGFETG